MSIARERDPNLVVTHPNRESAAAKSTRLVVIVLQLASAALLFLILFGSAGVQAGAVILWFIFGVLFLYYAYATVNWRSGVLPMVAGTAIFSGVFAAVSVTSWFDRSGPGYDPAPIDESILGVLVFAFAILQLVNLVVALKAFTQQWQVELEVPRDQLGPDAHVGKQPATA